MQYERPPNAWRQRGNGSLQIHRRRHVDRGGTPFIHFVRIVDIVLGERDARETTPFTPPLHEHRVDGDAMQPRRDARLPAKLRQRLPRLDENILRQLTRLNPVTRESQAQREHSARVRPVQLLERLHFAALRP